MDADPENPPDKGFYSFYFIQDLEEPPCMLNSLWDLFQIPIVHPIIVPVRQWSDSLGAYQHKAGVNNEDSG